MSMLQKLAVAGSSPRERGFASGLLLAILQQRFIPA